LNTEAKGFWVETRSSQIDEETINRANQTIVDEVSLKATGTVMFTRVIVISTMLASPLPAFALSAFDRMVLEELSCANAPKPTGILRALVEAKKIDPAQNIGYDSMSCWKIVDGISVAGMSFQSVCAFEEDDAIRSFNEDLYYRGPGTSPGQMISFGASVSGDELSDWYIRVFGPSNVSSAISEGLDTTLQEPSEVSCTGWMQ